MRTENRRTNYKIRKLIMYILAVVFFIRIIVLPNMYLYKYLKYENKIEILKSDEETNVFTVMSYNIRCKNLLDIGKKSWFYRADLIMKNIESIMPDILGFQEVTNQQYRYLKESLAGYSGIIEYRDNMPWSEGCPIFFNKERYELKETETFWLSETPDRMSKGWGAANYRICTSVLLYDKKTDTEVAVYNVHLDHKSQKAREKGIELVYEKSVLKDNIPVILLGDFNMEETSESYGYITEFFEDVKYKTQDREMGNTYNAWGENNDESPIDYIMITPKSYEVGKYSILREEYGGVYPSDHFPIYVELRNR